MYSPKIADRFIPSLYRAAKAHGVPMTTLVNAVIAAFLADQPDADAMSAHISRPRAPGCAPGAAAEPRPSVHRASAPGAPA
jgi:hypothetical protein